jgi:hypothetical protein
MYGEQLLRTLPNALRAQVTLASSGGSALPFLLGAAAFVIDILTPNGLLDGLLYIPAVLACVRVPAPRAPLYTAGGLMLPMILGLFLSPSGASFQVAVSNLCAAVGTIWLAAYALFRNACSVRDASSTLEELTQKLSATEQAAREERASLSDWLHGDISPELDVLIWRIQYLPNRGAKRGFNLRTESVLLRRAIERARQSARVQERRLRQDARA